MKHAVELDLAWTVPVWEVILTVLLTGVVTFVTIRWSVAISKREMQHQMAQRAADEAQREGERVAAVEAARVDTQRADRRSLALEAMSTANALWEVHSRDRRGHEPLAEQAFRIELTARWRTLGVIFSVSQLDESSDVWAALHGNLSLGLDRRAWHDPLPELERIVARWLEENGRWPELEEELTVIENEVGARDLMENYRNENANRE